MITEATQMDVVTNRAARESFRLLTDQIVAAGGSSADLLAALECVIAGVLLSVCKPGGDEAVLEAVTRGALERVADARLRMAEPRGAA